MSTYQHVCFCNTCNKPTVHLAEKANHILHLLITLCSAGWWIPVWLFISFKNSVKDIGDCTECGGTQARPVVAQSKSAHSIGYKLGKLFR